MDVREFQYIVTIAEHKSITKAATKLYVTPSALSKFVQNKEHEMGVLLFKRIGKQFIPTYAGEKCVEAAQQILAINTKLAGEMEQLASHGKGRIRLAFHSSWSDFFFMIIYPQFLKKYPDVDLKLYEVNNDQMLQIMDNGELDIAIVSATWKQHSRYRCEPLRTQQIVVAVSDNHPLLEKAVEKPGYTYPYIEAAQLALYPIIMRHSYQQTWAMMNNLFHGHGFEPRVVLETSSRENALRAVEHGVGLTITLDDPTWLLTHKNIRYLSFDNPDPAPVYINAIYSRGASLSSMEDDLLTLIKNHYRVMA